MAELPEVQGRSTSNQMAVPRKNTRKSRRSDSWTRARRNANPRARERRDGTAEKRSNTGTGQGCLKDSAMSVLRQSLQHGLTLASRGAANDAIKVLDQALQDAVRSG